MSRATVRRAILAASTIALASLSSVSPSTGAGERPAAVQFTHLPAHAIAGQSVTIGVATGKADARCALAVKYANGAPQGGLGPKDAAGGQLSWTWTIPVNAQASTAHVTVGCGSERITGKLLVVGSRTAARLSVVKDGFSVRPAQYGSGNDVSYGVVIKNSSKTNDALNVNVTVNFVLANDHLLGTNSDLIPEIPAGTTYNLGNDLSFPGAAPISRLEIVMQVAGTQAHVGHPPALENIVVEPDTTNSSWVGDVAGEVINNDPVKTMSNVQFSAVLLDGAGDVIGGANGSSYGTVPPGTRVVFKLTRGGVGDVPMGKAVSVLVSATPTWQTSG